MGIKIIQWPWQANFVFVCIFHLSALGCSWDCTSKDPFRLNLLPKLMMSNGECDEKISDTHTHTPHGCPDLTSVLMKNQQKSAFLYLLLSLPHSTHIK